MQYGRTFQKADFIANKNNKINVNYRVHKILYNYFGLI